MLDRSGSMSGRINKALNALALLIQSLPPNSKFNVVSFGSNYSFLFNDNQDYNNETMADALNKIREFSSNMGGTEIFNPIEKILSIPYDFRYPRNIFILTDGEIYNTETLLNKIKENCNSTRVHSIGIGTGVSKYLVNEIAKAGKGISVFVSDNDPLFNIKVISGLKKATRPSLTNIEIDWKDNKNNLLFSSPQSDKFMSLYEEEPFHLYAIFSDENLKKSSVTLNFYNTFTLKTESIILKIDPSKTKSTTPCDFYITAHRYLDYLQREVPNSEMIIPTSINYSVLWKKTAYFGKIKNMKKQKESMELIEVPIKKLEKSKPVESQSRWSSFPISNAWPKYHISASTGN